MPKLTTEQQQKNGGGGRGGGGGNRGNNDYGDRSYSQQPYGQSQGQAPAAALPASNTDDPYAPCKLDPALAPNLSYADFIQMVVTKAILQCGI